MSKMDLKTLEKQIISDQYVKKRTKETFALTEEIAWLTTKISLHKEIFEYPFSNNEQKREAEIKEHSTETQEIIKNHRTIGERTFKERANLESKLKAITPGTPIHDSILDSIEKVSYHRVLSKVFLTSMTDDLSILATSLKNLVVILRKSTSSSGSGGKSGGGTFDCLKLLDTKEIEKMTTELSQNKEQGRSK